MNRCLFCTLTFLAFCLISAANSATAENSEPTTSYFLIGNSLTWDTVPQLLDGDVQFHVDCGKSLPFIAEHPEKPCVKASSLWPEALANKQYDYVSVQPHYGSALEEDFDAIGKWIEMQSKAIFVVHTGWARHESRAEEFANTDVTGNLGHSPAYIAALINKLRKRYPTREFRQTLATEALNAIAKDIASGDAPFEDIEDLYRDKIHMTLDYGRYLMHNLMRSALGQSYTSEGFKERTSDGQRELDPEVKKYLDEILREHER